ncbi:hypothetical protein Tco_1466172 [Tanacetum coccineum]
MTNADQGATEQQNVSQQSGFEQVEEDAHLLNLENPSPADNEIASLMETSARHAMAVLENTSGFTTTIPPPPPFFNPLLQQATPTPSPTTFEATTSFPSLKDFASVFKFNERVFNLEKDVLEIKQVDQYAQALSSIPAIVDRYMDNKLGEAINKAILAHNLDCRKEAQDEKNAYIELILPQAVSDFENPVIDKNVTESVEAVVSTMSSSQPTSTYEAAASLSEFELTKILIDKMEKNKSYDKADYKKKLYDALVESYNTNKDLFDSYGEVFSLKRSRDDSDKDRDPSTGSDRGKKRRKSSKDAESFKDSSLPMQRSQVILLKTQACNKIKSSSRETMMNNPLTKSQVAHAEEPPTSFDELNDTSFDFSAFFLNWLKILNLTREIMVGLAFNLLKEGDFKRLRLQEIEDMLLLLVQQKLTNLKIDEQYDLNVALRMYTRRIGIQRRVEDLQSGVKSYQKKLNLTKPNTYRSNLRNKTSYTSHSDPHGIIYVDQYKRKRLMRSDELHKFSDGTLSDV